MQQNTNLLFTPVIELDLSFVTNSPAYSIIIIIIVSQHNYQKYFVANYYIHFCNRA